MFEEETGKKVEKVGLCVSDFNEDIALSPDGLIKNGKKYTEAVECKCLGSAWHLKAIIEKELPSDYELQVLQYFIVNEDLEKLYFVFYDPRIICKPYFCIEITRDEVKEDIEKYKEYQINIMNEINQIIEELAF
jgi:predicted phage-related endonuclease